MAKKHYLFFGLLLIALCLIKGFGNRTLELDALPDEVSQQADRPKAEPSKLDQRQGEFSEQALRQSIVKLAVSELGVREATGRNDGPRVEEYLRYTKLGKGYAWCAAFVSWVYGQAGLAEPRNPWSPALFPDARSYCKGGGSDKIAVVVKIQAADLFGIYGAAAKRINHVGLVKERQGKYLLTVEGNSNNRVEARRRHLKTVYALSNWIDQ